MFNHVQSFSWNQCVLRHLFLTYPATHWTFGPTAGNVFPTAGSFPPALCFQLLIFGSLGSSAEGRLSTKRRILPTIPVEQISNSVNSFHLSIQTILRTKGAKKRNNVGNSFNVWSFFFERTGCNLGLWILLPNNWPNLLNKNQWKHKCTASNQHPCFDPMIQSKHISSIIIKVQHEKHRRFNSWGWLTLAKIANISSFQTLGEGFHLAGDKCLEKLLKCTVVFDWSFPRKSDTGRCLYILGPDVPIQVLRRSSTILV